ncbi:hypothetical protein SCUCBS95973_007297 [Sporothrix curviconia]|uniref:DUF427 domain-containing protein n=1 Tax=Sporothrix curviconia TaxID=1260050 RepID=A0ABP0CCN0_9PEZI
MVDFSSLAANGPIKQEPTKRRIRAQLNGQWVVDTLDAVFVWESKYYPVYYVPVAAVENGPATVTKNGADSSAAGFTQGQIDVKGTTASVVFFDKGPLAGLARLEGVDWFAEDEKLIGGHPKDPYARIECLSSSRRVRVELRGTVLADSTNNVFLHESNLRTRHYLSPTAVVDHSVLRPSTTTTFCPYKGQASYYDVVLADGTEVKDGVWYYPIPTAESAPVHGRLAFYNEKFDVFIDGVKEAK